MRLGWVHMGEHGWTSSSKSLLVHDMGYFGDYTSPNIWNEIWDYTTQYFAIFGIFWDYTTQYFGIFWDYTSQYLSDHHKHPERLCESFQSHLSQAAGLADTLESSWLSESHLSSDCSGSAESAHGSGETGQSQSELQEPSESRWWFLIWGFPKIGVPLNHIHFKSGFSLINHPFWGSPIYGSLHTFWCF